VNGFRPGALLSSFPSALAAITLAGLALRAFGLASQPPLGDDFAAGLSAIAFVERGEISGLIWQHPRLRDLLVYASTALLGPTKLGLCFPSLAAGVASIPVVGLLARRLAGPAAGLVAAALTAVDPLHLAFSRQAVHDVYMFLFPAAGVLLALAHARSGRRRDLVLAGVAFGLGLASRWIAAVPLAIVTAFLLVRQARDRAAPDRERALAFTAAALAVLPVAVYLLTWTPWFAQGRDLGDWTELQRTMWAEALVHEGFNPATRAFSHRAALWFVWPAWWADFTAGPRGHVVYLAITNPLVWLATLPAMSLSAWRAVRSRSGSDALMVALFAATWLPLVFAPRPVFLNAGLALLPFALVPVAALASRVAGAGSHPRARLAAYLGVVVLSSAPLLLLASGAATHLAPFRGLIERFRPEARFEGLAAPVPSR